MRTIRGAMILVLTFFVAMSFIFTDIATCMEIDFDNLCYRNSRLTDYFANPWTNQAGSAQWYVYGRIQESRIQSNSDLRVAKNGYPLFSNNTYLWKEDVQALQDGGQIGYYIYNPPFPAGVPNEGDIAVWNNGHVAFVENTTGNVTESGIALPRAPMNSSQKTAFLAAKPYIVINWNGINLRKQPSLKGMIRRKLNKYSVWEIIDGPTFNNIDNYAWFKIKESGNSGWVALQFSPNGQSMSRVFLDAHTPSFGTPNCYLRIPKTIFP